jgi:hypothetical protein
VSTDAFTPPKTTRSHTGKKKVYVRVGNQTLHVTDGSFFTRSPWEQWHGWRSEAGRHQRGLRYSLSAKVEDLLMNVRQIEALIDAGLTYTSYDGEVTKLIEQYDEEQVQWELEYLRDSVNQTLNKMNLRRPLKRRIELMQEVTVERGATPGEAANARAMIERLEQRLEES